MNRSQQFIILSLILLFTGGWCVFNWTKYLHKNDTVKAVNAEKEKGFREEVVILDSLYHDYVEVLGSSDQSAIAGADALLQKQCVIIKKQYAGSSPPAVLAAKLIRNYEVRLLLTHRMLDRKNLQSGEVSRLTKLVKGLEDENKELKTQNQMVQQALLSLPQ